MLTAQAGDEIKFGQYEQDNDLSNGQEQIDWIVLENTGEELFIISKYCLAGKTWSEGYKFNEKYNVWKYSTLRTWLNDEFYNDAFATEDSQIIKTSKLENNDFKIWGNLHDGGGPTEDKVFLLSADEKF